MRQIAAFFNRESITPLPALSIFQRVVKFSRIADLKNCSKIARQNRRMYISFANMAHITSVQYIDDINKYRKKRFEVYIVLYAKYT